MDIFLRLLCSSHNNFLLLFFIGGCGIMKVSLVILLGCLVKVFVRNSFIVP